MDAEVTRSWEDLTANKTPSNMVPVTHTINEHAVLQPQPHMETQQVKNGNMTTNTVPSAQVEHQHQQQTVNI